MSIYVRDHISFIERPDLNQFDNSIESIFIEVNKDQLNTTKNILIGVIYRPPNQDMDIFNEKISEMLETIRKEEKFCYLLGDCNINILNYESHRLTGDFVDLLSSYSFLPLITHPTRITASSATLIDYIFTNHIENLDHSTQGLLVTDVSDHYPIFHINNRSYIGESDIYVIKRIFSERNKQAFKIALNELDWNEIYGAFETNNAFHRFHDTLGTLLNKYFPKVRIKRKYTDRKPWLTDSLRMTIKTKNELYYCYKRINCVKNEVKYKTNKSKLQKLLKVAEKQYYQELLMKYKNNTKKSWGIIKSIINKNKSHLYQTKFKLSDGKIVSDRTTISKHFNEFFLNVGPNLAKTIPKMDTDPKFYMGESIKKSLFLEPVTFDETMKIVSSLKETATGYDDINAMFLKMSAEYICNPLAHICNLSFQEGVFPDSLKIANVIPLYKSDDPMFFNNYRPVSLLSVLSKVFERLMYNRLMNFLEKIEILYENQFGFRKDCSTHMALLTLVDKLIQALENGEYVVGVFLDFSKAFDTVDHSILLEKLFHYGIQGSAYSWFQSYLSNRSQCVTYDGVESSLGSIKCGVPQGSILGPLLFLLYINDLSFVCKYTFPVLFADDTNLFLSGKDVSSLSQMMTSELGEISEWLKVNKLSLNIKKTHYIVFSGGKRPPNALDIKIDNQEISRVLKTKFLGVVVDCKLSWKEHIAYITGKIARGIGVISKARRYHNRDSLLSLHYSFIYHYLIYCNHVWGAAAKTHTRTLCTLQKRVVRIISGVKPRTHSVHLFKELNLLKFQDINTYLIGKLMFKVYNDDLVIFETWFEKNNSFHDYNTRQKDQYHIPSFKTKLGQCSLRFSGATIWNSIYKLGITKEPSEFSFSKTLKQFLLLGILWNGNYIPGGHIISFFFNPFSTLRKTCAV